MTDSRSLVAVGRIVKVFGVHGEVVVKPLTAAADRFHLLTTVLAGRTEEDVHTYTVGTVRVGERGVRMSLEEVPDRTAAEGLVGMYLFVTPEERITPAPGSYFVEDIVGLRVRNEEGTEIGTVTEVLHMPAHDVYRIGSGGTDILLPAVRQFVLGIDMKQGVMTVRLIEGMRGEG